MVVSQFAVAALYERRPAVEDHHYKNQTETLPKKSPTPNVVPTLQRPFSAPLIAERGLA